MTQETNRSQRTWGVVFITLAVLLYALVFAGSYFKQPVVGKLQQNLKRLSVNEELVQALPAKQQAKMADAKAMKVALQVNTPAAICLLLLGVAWVWNSKRQIGIWLYRILAAYFLLTALAFLTALFLKQSGLKTSYLVVGSIVGLAMLGAGALLLWRAGKLAKRSPQTDAATVSAAAPVTEVAAPARAKAAARGARKRYNSCSVLQVGADRRHIWQFDSRGGEFVLGREQAAVDGEALPASIVTKTWSSLWQPKLNVAWLPPESVFMRVAHLPAISLEETISMVEFQLERLSPIPVTQAVWSLHVLPQMAGNLQTVIVLFAERKAVEEFLGQLEGQSYLADRLEVSALDQLQATPVTEDGAWIFPEAVGGHRNALVAWWNGGALQNLSMLSLPAEGEGAAAVREQLSQLAWAGELEGWLNGAPTWHLVADETLAAEWEPSLRQGLDAPIQVTRPPRAGELAGLTARRAVANAASNLLPVEFTTRYQQQFVDLLWLRGLGAVVGIYLVGVVIYLLALGVLHMQTGSVEKSVASLGTDYTNVMQLKARFKVLNDRQELKFAALDCWKAVADVMPNEITLEGFNFSEGHKLSLSGSAASGQDKVVVDFYDTMRNSPAKEGPLFNKALGDPLNYRPGANSSLIWNFSLELKRTEQP